MPDFIQRSFAAGEVAPALYGRADVTKYQTGLRTCRNFFVRRHGGISNRTGGAFICEMKDSAVAHRVVRFAFNNDQTYVLLFGAGYMRVVKDDVLVQVSGVAAWSAVTLYTEADLVSLAGINYYCILSHTGQTPPNATYWYALTGTIYEIPTPFSASDIQSFYPTQSGDVVNIDSHFHAPLELSRFSDTRWVLDESVFAPAIGRADSGTATIGGAGAKVFRYKVTVLKSETFEESESGRLAPRAITGATKAFPCVLTVVAHGLTTGDEVYIDTVGGMIQLNGLTARITNLTVDTIALNGIDSRQADTYTSLGEVFRTFVAMEARAAGTAILFISKNNPPEVWSDAHGLATGAEVFIDGVVGMTQINNLCATVTVRGTTTAVITGATQANPCNVTAVGHGFSTGDRIFINGVTGMTQLNGVAYTITVTGANNFTLGGIDSTAFTAYAANGVAHKAMVWLNKQDSTNFTTYTSGGTLHAVTRQTAADPTAVAPHVISWAPVSGAAEYSVYKEENGVYGYVGSSGGSTFNDTNIAPDLTVTPPLPRTPFVQASDYPSVNGYFEQRRIHANTIHNPQKTWMSRTGRITNFTISTPLQDDDAVTFTLAGLQVHEVRHIADIGAMIVLTAGGEWVLSGDSSGTITPKTPGAKQVGYHGAAEVHPVIAGNNLLYVQARGNMVRDLRSVISTDGTQGWSGDDLTVFAPHLFEGTTVVRWDYAQIPHSTVWAVRSDGKMLGLTYVKQHEIQGWHQHDTQGLYEDVVVLPRGDEDAVYYLVQRTINGATKRYLEKFPSRRVTDVEIDALFLDSHLTYNGWNAGATTMQLLGGVTWLYTETLSMVASANAFTAGDVGNSVMLEVAGEDRLECRIVAYLTPVLVSVQAVRNVPAAYRGLLTTDWALAVDTVSGLGHLEGMSVGILADGNVVSNGIDAPLYTVTGGQVSLLRAYAVVHVGLGYVSDAETLDLDIVGIETLAPKQKQITGITTHVESSRGFLSGEDEAHLFDVKLENLEVYTGRSVITGKINTDLQNTWNNTGRYLIRQQDPLPLTILAVMPHGEIGG